MEKKFTIMILIAIVVSSLTQAQIKSPGEILEDVRSKITKITVDELKNKLEFEHQFTLIDLRTEKEYLAGHIEDAVWIPRGFLEFKIQEEISDPESEIVLYCKGGGRSAFGVVTLNEMGYKNVLNLEGGFREWVNNGYSVFNMHGEIEVINFEKQENE